MSYPNGESHPKAKITWKQAQEIRSRRAFGESYKSLAREFGISKSCIVDICKNRSWKRELNPNT